MSAEHAEPTTAGGTSISVVTLEDATVVQIVGEIDLATIAEAESATRAAVDCGLPIRLDLAGTTFMDSTGVGFVARMAAAEHDRGRTLSIANAVRNIAETLRVSGLGDLIAFA